MTQPKIEIEGMEEITYRKFDGINASNGIIHCRIEFFGEDKLEDRYFGEKQ